MSATTPARMTADEFIAWAMQQPEGQRYELVDGEAVGMAPERAGMHAPSTGSAKPWARQFGQPDCPEAFPDGMSVRVDADTVP